MKKTKKIIGWVFIVLFGLFVLMLLIRLPFFLQNRRTAEQVVKIHATKLTLDDVMGKNLPPDPGANADKTVQGIDANNNGIRDDVELAVFKAYPNSAKTRAVLLQYALSLQTQMTLPIINKETVTATVEDNDSRAHICIWSLSSRSDMNKFITETDKNEKFIENLQLNHERRKNYLTYDIYEGHLMSYSSSNEGCDLNLSTLPN